MKKRNDTNISALDGDPAIERLIYLSYCAAGWLFAQRPADVAKEEARQKAHGVECPEELLYADKIWSRLLRKEHAAPQMKPPVDPSAVENLAQAAREGVPIPASIREKMRRDREAAERKKDQ